MWVQVWKKARVFDMSPVVFGQDPQVPVAGGQGYLVYCFGKAVVASDMPEPCEFLSLDSCQKTF